MKKTILTALATFVLGIGVTVLVLTNPFEWEWMHRLGHAVMDFEGEGDEAQLWTCGMHPEVIRDEPGQCPICHMELVPVQGASLNGKGDGNKDTDWVVTEDLTLDVRAERSGRGSGRIYTVEVTCTDGSGNSSSETTSVTVAHDKRK